MTIPSDPANACPGCGAMHSKEDSCPACGTPAGGREDSTACAREAMVEVSGGPCGEAPRLRALPASGNGGTSTRGDVRLVRELKGPTVRGLVSASPASIQRLPGKMLGSLQALRRGDLAEAEARFDAAVGQVLEGPWAGEHRRWRRRHVLWPSGLLVLASILLVLATWLLV